FDVELTEEPVKVYNFEVDEFHTYHVGEIGVWVHNANADYNLSETEYRKIGEDDTISFGENEETVIYRRVQGGDGSSNSSQQKITVNENGSISIANKNKNLNISIDNGEHSTYFKNEVRGNEAYTVEFEVPKWFDDLLQENTISQDGYRSNPLNQGGTAPKLTDISTPGRSYELPAPWSEWIEEVATNGKIIE
ncbi:polymorphic toxin-type HINT domain-containing protein, partial [Ruminococcus bicirculans (ex Wegman et al. 2014)]|uniref:polymorphic toxin-type HINT domain-containing protein n=2 Tax=Ruminococcus bicirculans (ex Wegman et al. 2014) TaxID=1160721 RepID=UPI002432C5E0